MKFNLPNNNGMLPNDHQRAIKNHRLMTWAKIATFGLYMVAVFMLYVSDVWGVASFIEKNSNEYIALVVFSVISFVLAFFLASSKEAVYEDIALHRSEGWKLKPTQYAAMGLFLSSGILFEMFSTTNNQQHIANTAAEQSSMMKSIQGTEVSLSGSSSLTDSFASAQMKLAQCKERMNQGKEKHCQGATARVEAIRESMAMSNQLATTAAKTSMDNKVDGMLKIREHFDKPMFQAIGKATGTDNNSGMLMVVGSLIFVFELQHIMALFAYANSLARINRKVGNSDNAGYASPTPLDESAPMAALTNAAKQTVGEYAAKVEAGLKASPEIIAREYARADYANKQVLADAGCIGGKIGAKLDAALYPPTMKESGGFKQSPEQLAFVQGEYAKQMREYENANLAAMDGSNTVKYLAPRMSVEETVKAIQSNVKASGETSPAAIRAAVFDGFAALPNPAPLGDAILERIAGKLTVTTVTAVPAQSEQTRTDAQSEQHEQPVTTVPAQSQHEAEELTGSAKQAENDLYPQWLELVKSSELTAGARDAKRFISQATKSSADKTGLTIQEMGRIWLNWQARASNDGVLTANPKYQAGNRQPKYLKAA
jgi:hypothetical protein